MAEIGPDNQFGIVPCEQRTAMTGFEFISAVGRGEFPQPPITKLLKLRIVTVERGKVAFRGQPSNEMTNPMGTVHGGWYGTILDSAMGCAVMTVLEKNRMYTTLEFKVNLTRALPIGMEALAIGEVMHAGRSTAVANGRLEDLDGRLYAFSTSTCILFDK
ncbi:MAG: PaaI family thioesterase [Albidovulum sp.]|nr:PaaI family thioesterase [Albidovulum sp.]